MFRTTVLAIALAFTAAAPGASSAEDYAKNPAATVRVRYMVSDLPAAKDFYVSKLGFKVDIASGTYFAALSRNGLQLLLSPVSGPGGASRALPDGRRPERSGGVLGRGGVRPGRRHAWRRRHRTPGLRRPWAPSPRPPRG